MKNYQKQLGKITLASLLLATPILTVLPATEAYAATSNTEMEAIFNSLPATETLTIEADGSAIFAMYTAYNSLSSTNKKPFKDQYEAIFEVVKAEMIATYEDPTIGESSSLLYFTNLFSKLMKLIDALPTMKEFDEITLADKTNMTALNTYVTAVAPYYDTYVKDKTVYTVDDIVAAYNKTVTLSNADTLEKKVALLPPIDQLTLANSKAFSTAQTAYTTLVASNFLTLDKPKQAIEQYKTYENRYKELEIEGPANTISSTIKTIGTVENVKLEDTEKIETAYKLYATLLIDEVKESIDYDLVQKMRLRVGQLKGIELDTAIQKLQSVDAIQLHDEAELNRIKTEYALLLTANAKSYVTNYELFLTMQTRLAQLKTAGILDTKILALPALEGIGVTDSQALAQLRQELNKLDLFVLDGMNNYQAFLELENKVNELKQQDILTQVNHEIAALSATVTKSEIQLILTNYQLLTSENQQKVEGKKDLAYAISNIVSLEIDMSKSLNFYTLATVFMKSLTTSEQEFIAYSKWKIYETEIKDYNELVKSVSKIENEIDQLPFVVNLEEVDYSRVSRVYTEFQSLSENAKTAVTSKYREKITELMAIVSQKKSNQEIAYVKELIESIPTTVKSTDEATIEKARVAYEKLTVDQKKEIKIEEVLIKAEQDLFKSIQELKQKNNEQKQAELIELDKNMLLLEPSKLDVADKKEITQLRKLYNSLTKEEKAQLTNYKKLTEAEMKMENLFLEVSKLEDTITNLDPLKSAVAVSNARAIYNNLTLGQKNLIRNLDMLELYEFFLKEGLSSNNKEMNAKLEEALAIQNSPLPNIVYDLINKLPTVEKVTLENRLEIMHTKESYNQLSAILQNRVGNSSKLIAVEAKLVSLQKETTTKVDKIDQLISKLPHDINLSNEAEIEFITKEIDKLSFVEQSYLKKYDDFLVAVEKLSKSKEQDAKVIKKILLSINALPALNMLTLNYERILEELQTDYSKLNVNQKSKVTNIAVLTAAVEQLEKLQSSFDEVEEYKSSETEVENQIKAVLTVLELTNMTTKISGKATPNSTIFIYKGKKKIATTTSTNKGFYSASITAQKKKTTLKLVVENKKKVIKTVTKVVKAARVDAAKSLKATQKTVSGKAPKKAIVKVYKNNLLVKTIKVNSKGQFKATIAKQKKKTVLKVYVYDKANNRSGLKKVTVK